MKSFKITPLSTGFLVTEVNDTKDPRIGCPPPAFEVRHAFETVESLNNFITEEYKAVVHPHEQIDLNAGPY